MLPSSQQFVYGTLFAKLIFPPFKWEPASERNTERERERAREQEGGIERARAKSVKVRQAVAVVGKKRERETCLKKRAWTREVFFPLCFQSFCFVCLLNVLSAKVCACCISVRRRFCMMLDLLHL